MKPITFFTISSVVLFALSGCGEKSIEYYTSNQAEARQVIQKCDEKGLAMLGDQNCVNAIEGNAKAVRAKTRAVSKGERESLQKFQAELDAANNKK